MPTTPNITEGWLRRRYEVDGASQTEIAAELGVDRGVIRRRLDAFGIPRRTASSRQRSDDKLNDRDWLHKQYVMLRRSAASIAVERECSVATVHNWLERHNIPTRSAGPATDERLDDPEWLRVRYVDERASSRMIADEIGSSSRTVLARLRQHGIPIRTRSEPVDDRLTDAEWLAFQVNVLGRTPQELADEIGVSFQTVYRHLQSHDIDTGQEDGPVPPIRTVA